MNDMIKKVLTFKVREVAPRVLEFVGSTEDVDRQGDIIMASGWQLKQYKKNPVFLWAHGYAEPPVGKAIKVWAEEDRLKFHIQFAERDEYEFADTIYKLYKGGFLRASSVGFIPLESEPIETKEDEDSFFGRPTRYLKQELLELSGCPVPANPFALAEAKAKGIITDAQEIAKKSPGWAIKVEVDSETAKLLKGIEKRETEATEAIKEALEIAPDPRAEERPYPNEHACRLRNPDDFQEDSFKRTEREHEGKKYSIIMAKLTDETTMTEQAYRYPKDTWTEGEAKAHCADHDGTFEAASGTDAVGTLVTAAGDALAEQKDQEIIEAQVKDSEEIKEEIASRIKEISQEEIADNIDYLCRAIDAGGLNDANLDYAWELVRRIFDCSNLRETGSDIPADIAEKIGAVLNKLNRERLEQIQALAQSVLDSAEHQEEPDKSLTRDEVTKEIGHAVREVIEQAQGKVK